MDLLEEIAKLREHTGLAAREAYLSDLAQKVERAATKAAQEPRTDAHKT